MLYRQPLPGVEALEPYGSLDRRLGGVGHTVEADETYLLKADGKRKHAGAGGYGHKMKVLSLTERGGRNAGGPVLISIKAAKVLADDFVGSVAFDALGAGIPGGDVAVFIKLKDRIIDHRIDELPVPRFAFN